MILASIQSQKVSNNRVINCTMEQDNDVVTVKSVLLAVMFVVSAFFVALPILTMQIRRVKEGNATRRKFILSLFNCFGGGIFVSVGKLT